MKVGKTEEGLYTEFVVFVEICEWAVISKSFGLNKKKTQQTAVVGKHSDHFLFIYLFIYF